MIEVPGIDGVRIFVIADIGQITAQGLQPVVKKFGHPCDQLDAQVERLPRGPLVFSQGRKEGHLRHSVGIFRAEIRPRIGVAVSLLPGIGRRFQVRRCFCGARRPVAKRDLWLIEVWIDVGQHVDEIAGAGKLTRPAVFAPAQENIRNRHFVSGRQRMYGRGKTIGRCWRLVAELWPLTAHNAVRFGFGYAKERIERRQVLRIKDVGKGRRFDTEITIAAIQSALRRFDAAAHLTRIVVAIERIEIARPEGDQEIAIRRQAAGHTDQTRRQDFKPDRVYTRMGRDPP